MAGKRGLLGDIMDKLLKKKKKGATQPGAMDDDAMARAKKRLEDLKKAGN